MNDEDYQRTTTPEIFLPPPTPSHYRPYLHLYTVYFSVDLDALNSDKCGVGENMLKYFSGYRSSSVRPSVCLKRSCTLLRRLKYSAMFLRHLVRWSSADIQVNFYGDRPRRTSPSGELNTTGVAEYSDFGPIERYISETVKDRS